MLLNGVEPGGGSYAQLQSAVFGASPGNQLGLEALNGQLQQLSTSLVKVSALSTAQHVLRLAGALVLARWRSGISSLPNSNARRQ
jgi:hypothetical protein